MTDRLPLRRALISVYDKTGLDDLGRALAAAGVDVISTGATARCLRDAGCPVTEVADVTGFPECLDGRVKTLHPRVHAGLLADRRRPAHVDQLADLGVQPFDLVVSNLYPFAATVASGASPDDCLEQIDIGGPAMVRAAAKNYPSVAVVTSPDQYPFVTLALAEGGFSLATRQELARQAFRRVATYDIEVATWLGEQSTAGPTPIAAAPTGALVEATAEPAPPTPPATPPDTPPDWLAGVWTKTADLRYGENPHQAAALYQTPGGAGLAQARQLHGKAMSYNNYTDADAAYRACHDFAQPAVAIMKHANPCGIALGADIAEAHRKAHACDPLSAYGGVVAANRPVTLLLAEQLAPIFTEVVIAPDYEPAALDRLTAKKNLRLLQAGPYPRDRWERRAISGGLVVQRADRIDAPGDDPAAWRLLAGPPADEATLEDLAFAWRAVRAVKSNAVLLAHQTASVGVGMGQVNRVDSCRLAVSRAGDRAAGSVAASDAFFPFADGPGVLIEAGVTAIVEPGGSIRDDETIAACAAAGVTLYVTGTRHFFH